MVKKMQDETEGAVRTLSSRSSKRAPTLEGNLNLFFFLTSGFVVEFTRKSLQEKQIFQKIIIQPSSPKCSNGTKTLEFNKVKTTVFKTHFDSTTIRSLIELGL